MKSLKFIIILLCTFVTASFFAGCKSEGEEKAENSNRTITASEARRTPTYPEYVDYSYRELKKEADIIVHVKITDELTNKNSRIMLDASGMVYDFISERNADIIKMYKNTTGEDFGKSMNVFDCTAVTDDGDLLVDKGDTYLLKDNEYILFLKLTTSGSGYCVMSGPTGKINLTDFTKNNDYITEIKFLLDYEAKAPNELIEKILSLEPNGEMIDFTEYENTNIPTNYGNIEVVQAKLQGDKLHFELHFGEHSITLANFKAI